MIDVSVDVTRTRNLGPRTRKAVMEYIEAGADRGFATYLQEMPVDRGNMQQNSYSPTRDGDTVRYGTRDIPYARAQDEGTGPIPNLPIAPLLEWGERVGAPGGAVWAKIREEGIEPKHFSRAAREEQRTWYQTHSVDAYIQREFR